MRSNELFLVNISPGDWNEQFQEVRRWRKKSHNLLNNSPLRSLYSAGELIVNCCKILFLPAMRVSLIGNVAEAAWTETRQASARISGF
jgi:hypothetical protein